MSSLHSKRKDAGNRGHSYEHLNPYKENPKPKGVWSRLQKTPPLFFGMILLLLCLVYFMTTKSSDRPILRNNIEQKKDPIMLVNQNQNPIIESLAFDVTVMTFNLRYASASDGINSWVHRKEHLFSIINAYQPMIMGTQEGLKDQLAEIHQAIHPFYRRFGIEREVNGEYEQIFYDSRKFRFVRGDNFWLSDTPDVRHTKGWDAACVRLCTWVELEHVETHTTMYVFNTQYDHVGLSSQNESAILTWNRIQSIVPNPDVPLVLMGDFNTYRHLRPYTVLTTPLGANLADAWIEAENRIGTISNTYHGWQGTLWPKEKGESVGYGHIDWILFRPRTNHVKMTKVITETSRYGTYPSDHYPIISTIEFHAAS